MSKSALIVYGGWEGHHPRGVAELFRRVLTEDGFVVEMTDSIETFDNPAKLARIDLLVPHWTMGKITNDQTARVLKAVEVGMGVAGCHGGMCDAFRENCEWQFLTGGQFVAHPGNDGTEHTVRVTPLISPITQGLSEFTVKSEQYYMHVDPAVKVLATTRFPIADGPHAANGPVDMPVVWTKQWGRGKVFYNSLGHSPEVLETEPCLTIMRRGFVWASK